MQADLCWKLDELGVDYREGIDLLGDNEELYIELLNQFLGDEDFERLREALRRGDASEGFFRVHSLKGMAMNLSLGRIGDMLVKLTRQLYAGETTGAQELFDVIDQKCGELREALKEANL